MAEDTCQARAPDREVNPLLFVFFCPHCVLSGVFALAATGLVSVPTVLGVPAEHYLAVGVILGSFLAWLAWGAWSKRCTKGAPCSSLRSSRGAVSQLD